MMNRKDSPLGGVNVHWNTFLDTDQTETTSSDSRVIVMPVPYDSTTSYKTGARYGPSAIIQASRHLEDYELGHQNSGVSVLYRLASISQELVRYRVLLGDGGASDNQFWVLLD